MHGFNYVIPAASRVHSLAGGLPIYHPAALSRPPSSSIRMCSISRAFSFAFRCQFVAVGTLLRIRTAAAKDKGLKRHLHSIYLHCSRSQYFFFFTYIFLHLRFLGFCVILNAKASLTISGNELCLSGLEGRLH